MVDNCSDNNYKQKNIKKNISQNETKEMKMKSEFTYFWQFKSTEAEHLDVVPLYCLMYGVDHPPNDEKSENEASLSQCGYHNLWLEAPDHL